MRTIRLLATVSALLFAAMAIYTWPLDPGIPAIQFTFTESAFKSILNIWQAADVSRFRIHFAMDFPFLLCYGALGFLMATRTKLFRLFPPQAKSLLALSLPCAATADAMENSLHLYFISGADPILPALYFAAGAAASAKWLLIGVFACAAVYARGRQKAGAEIAGAPK